MAMSLGERLRSVFSKSTIDEQTWDELLDELILSDFGPDASDEVVAKLREEVQRMGITDPKHLRMMLRDAIAESLSGNDSVLRLQRPEPREDGTALPAVVLVVGVNGVGKTTTLGKLAKFIVRSGHSVVLGAADTFRAAAVEQLATWAVRAGAAIVRPQQAGQDPASVAYQSVQYAIEQGTDVVLIDTAGRLQTKSGLMDELGKVRRVVEKLAPVAEVLLVLDATTGQNGVNQAEAFFEHAGVTGIVLTKLDGSTKGGIAIGVQQHTGIPVKLIGHGESIDDIAAFNPTTFAAELVGTK